MRRGGRRNPIPLAFYVSLRVFAPHLRAKETLFSREATDACEKRGENIPFSPVGNRRFPEDFAFLEISLEFF